MISEEEAFSSLISETVCPNFLNPQIPKDRFFLSLIKSKRFVTFSILKKFIFNLFLIIISVG